MQIGRVSRISSSGHCAAPWRCWPESAIPRSMPPLERLLSLGGPRIRLACINTMAARDPRGTASRYETFRSLLPPSAHDALDAAFSG